MLSVLKSDSRGHVDFHNSDLSYDWVSPECDPKCVNAEENGYIWKPDDKSSGVIQVQGHLKQNIDYC